MSLYAFDGTWNAAKNNEDREYKNTNVVRFFEAYHKRSNTNDFYVSGVGTRFDFLGRVAGGVFGLGEAARLREAYDHLCAAWAAGDRVIDVIGFSRGAATTLDFCHDVHEKGIRRPGTDEVVEAKPTIRFLGVWDIVAAFGLANLGATDFNIGHHLELPRSSLQYCFHAMALDERRPSFLPTRLPGAREVWFRGVHSDIGGGNGNRGLNDITLKWMMSKARAAGLPIAEDDIAALMPVPGTVPKPAHDRKLPLAVRVISSVDRRHFTVSAADGWANPPQTCPVETQAEELIAEELSAGGLEVMPIEVRRRIAAMWETADAVVTAHDFKLKDVRDPLLTLFQGRVLLVTNEEELKTARLAAGRLAATMVRGAQQRGFHALNDFFLNEALVSLPHMFPLTD